LGALYPWNGTATLRPGQVGPKSISTRALYEILDDSRARPLHVLGERAPFIYQLGK
jgi:hypothetical protein